MVVLAQPEINTKRIYIAGPMRGVPYFNVHNFIDAEAKLRENGWWVLNPVRFDIAEYGWELFLTNENGDPEKSVENFNFNLRKALSQCMQAICESDAIFMLEGWEKSRGAVAEFYLAVALGLDIYYQEWDDYPKPRNSVRK